jgi:hypothetical protein
MANGNDRDRVRELQLREARRKIDQGWACLERGEGIDGDAFFKQLEREELGRKRKRA